jgi:hypothetical protein
VIAPATLIERYAEATWWRCRSMVERKDGVRWHELSMETRQSWIRGVLLDMLRARVTFNSEGDADG